MTCQERQAALTGSVMQLLRNTERQQEWQEAISQVAVPPRGGAVRTPSNGATSTGVAHHFTATVAGYIAGGRYHWMPSLFASFGAIVDRGAAFVFTFCLLLKELCVNRCSDKYFIS